ncbi:density-regulated protein [Heterostelium album PN500]|uniref:Density-regulated protein n=1 Tax=Heterostelium pallidum (strain ATCC 26659 / Pp 5 / PN500) TaxID=670386 RepID=D3BJ38_HETP5|nr:density-regulated protein [Heterostelium album PN500]EFA77918.1 density-regulated protein [Heterostelium album PN500]|eukprot:XP_020430046.1 density-regulated protein [Heterostelium album PN500]
MSAVVSVLYFCGFPTEYCEFGPSPAACLAENGPCESAAAASTTPADSTTTTTTTTTDTTETADKLQQLKMVDDSKDEVHTNNVVAAPAAAAVAPAKKKKEAKPTITIELTQRTKRKHVTTIAGLEGFGIKLSDAAKLMAKKFSCGCSVVKVPSGGEEIDIQGDFQEEAVDFIVEKWSNVDESDIYFIEDKKKVKAR